MTFVKFTVSCSESNDDIECVVVTEGGKKISDLGDFFTFRYNDRLKFLICKFKKMVGCFSVFVVCVCVFSPSPFSKVLNVSYGRALITLIIYIGAFSTFDLVHVT